MLVNDSVSIAHAGLTNAARSYNDAMRIDVHTHCFPPRFAKKRAALLGRDRTFDALYSGRGSRMATAENLIAALDEAGFDAAVAAGIGWTDQEMAREANDYLLECAARFPRRIVPLCSVNPAWGDAALHEIARCAKAGAKGIGELHPDSQGFRLDDAKLLKPLADLARQLGLVVLTHVSEPVGHEYPGKGRTTPQQALAFAEAFPDVRLICAHWGGGLPFYAMMPEVGAALSNVWFDSAASPFLYQPRVFAVGAELIGRDKVLFGSDFPLLRPERVLRDLRASGLGEEAERGILGDNAARLFGLADEEVLRG